MQKFIQIGLPVNFSNEEKLVHEIGGKLEELKQIAYDNKNQDLVDVINSISLPAIEGDSYKESTYFSK